MRFLPLMTFSLVHAATGPPLKNGIWRAGVTRADGHAVIFNFRTADSAGKKILYVINGKEHLLVDHISVRGDSVFIKMPFFDSRFEAVILPDGNLSGKWIRNMGATEQVYAFAAVHNQTGRFDSYARPAFDVSGHWAAHFKGSEDSTEAIGEFFQQGSRVTGTFLTPTGDYRFLEGVVSGDTLKLSTFDGGHAYSFSAILNHPDSMIRGTFYAGAAGYQQWTAERNEKASLPDEYSLARLKPGETSLNFKFRSIDGQWISNRDAAFKNKVVIIQIMGSWCPNCMDETRFLSDYFKTHRSQGIQMIALAYERTANFSVSKKSLEAFRSRFGVDYPILVTGVTVSDTNRTEKTLPQLEHIEGFPTTIFIDKKGLVRKISTGFNGPGTGTHYEIYKKEFDALVSGLAAE
jgi:thiol-disulfide isomerase/thioredoxin